MAAHQPGLLYSCSVGVRKGHKIFWEQVVPESNCSTAQVLDAFVGQGIELIQKKQTIVCSKGRLGDNCRQTDVDL